MYLKILEAEGKVEFTRQVGKEVLLSKKWLTNALIHTEIVYLLMSL